MKLVVNLKLQPTPEQAKLLKRTLRTCNAACNDISQQGWDLSVFRQYDLHKLVYHDIRERFGLTAQAAVRCIAKVADAYKLDQEARRKFRPDSAQPYDDRILRFVSESVVSLWTTNGREKIAYICGERQRALLAHRKGEVDLMFVRGKFYLAAVCDFDEPALIEATDVLGVDFGIVNIATDSNGTNHGGEAVEKVRRRQSKRRRALQKVGTRSAKRALKEASGKQARFQKHTNHVVSKALVADAERGRCAIALEDLEGICDRVQVKKRQRARLHNWGFHQLRTFVTYKAQMKGLPIVLVDPRNTSRECSRCGLIDKRNRPNRDNFKCIGCGVAAPADHNAAINIRQRGLIARSPVVALQGTTACPFVSPKESLLL